ncbi:MAG TPA: helix-turn-helix domain-containing protein [Mycobacteriales bacterium]|jgi:transcriptional regulator GlxA family with amidase domain|nr:helix-turn-helix domain-containing protein [Mycobacteriales bacterium]
MLRDVAVAVCDDVSVFELGVVCEVFGIDRSDVGLPRYEFAVCAAEPGPLRTGGGFTIEPAYGLDRLATADLVAVPHWRSADEPPPPALLAALRDVVARGGRVMSVCSGAFVLAAAGLLDGRRATTHWKYAAALAARYPAIDVDPNVLYVDSGPVLTSAGTAAGIDLCLHLVREEHGPAVANAVARRMVVPPHRDGGQAQYVEAPVPEPRRDDLGDVLAWAVEHLDEPLAVDDLAARALMSPRTFARRFRAATGTTPYAWLLHQRTLHAQRLLEAGHGVEEVARRSGFGSAATLREHFARARGTSPRAYQRAFAGR